MTEGVYGVIDDDLSSIPKPKINKTSLPQGVDDIDVDNLIRVNEDLLRRILDRTDKATKHIASDLLENEIPMLLSYDNATAYAEAVMRDALSIDISIDDDVLRVLACLNKLSIIYQYSTMVKLPKSIRKLFVEEFTKALVPKALAEMEKSANTRKYSQNLRELVTHVESKRDSAEKEVFNKHGVRKSRSK